MYEKLQRFVLKTFELPFIELLIIGFPVTIFSIIGTLAGLNVSLMWPILVCMIAAVWIEIFLVILGSTYHQPRDEIPIPVERYGGNPK